VIVHLLVEEQSVRRSCRADSCVIVVVVVVTNRQQLQQLLFGADKSADAAFPSRDSMKLPGKPCTLHGTNTAEQ